MFISDPIKAFGLSDAQAKAFAKKLIDAARKYEQSWVPSSTKITGTHAITLLEAADNDPNIELALKLSWNESLDFASFHGFTWEE